MRAYELLETKLDEGGWDSALTANTVITPSIIKQTLGMAKKAVDDFNKYLEKNGEAPIKMGHPTGSSAYHDRDPEDKVYGDIDLQIIVPDQPGKTLAQIGGQYNKLLTDWVQKTKPPYIVDEGKVTGHPIFKIAEDQYVQVDFMWITEPVADWGRWRMTPEHNLKGLITGNAWSSLGNVLMMSLQAHGAQMKVKDGLPANYARTRKYDSLDTLTTSISTFGVDILKELYKRMGKEGEPQIHHQLEETPGMNTDNMTLKDLLGVVKGLGKSFELNDMWGQYNLAEITDYQDWIASFLREYEQKMEKQKNSSKFDKAEETGQQDKVEKIRKQIDDGVALVHKLMKD